MGRPKAGLPIAGSSLLLRVVENLLDCCWPIAVVARDGDQELPPLHTEVDVIHDLRPGDGPLAGLETGLRWLNNHDAELAFVCGCDHPFLTSAAVAWIAEHLRDSDRGVVCSANGEIQPLCSVWRVEVLNDIAALLADGQRSLKSLVDRVRPYRIEESEIRTFDPELRFLKSVDTPEDYEAARKVIEAAGS